jgi:cyclophilin family peptidyl-prolyl cis-trans isomerase
MAQTGDPLGTGTGGSPLPDLKAEFNDLPHLRGSVSMARAASNDSANSQFFLVFLPTMKLDGRYTVFGRITSGIQFVDAIERGEPPVNPSKIIKAWIEADGPNASRVALVIPPPAPVLAPVTAPSSLKPVPVKKSRIKKR